MSLDDDDDDFFDDEEEEEEDWRAKLARGPVYKEDPDEVGHDVQ